MDELKAIFAGNLIRLRTEHGMTQLELGSILNYSDKTVSKWERAEAIPDALVLKQLAVLFDVSVDYLLDNHDGWKDSRKEEQIFSWKALTITTLLGIWTLTLTGFVVLWIMGRIVWELFGIAWVASVITFLVFNSIWNGKKGNMFIVMLLVFSVYLLIYLLSIKMNLWQIFFPLIPSEAIVYFAYHITGKQKSRKSGNK